MKLSIFTPTHNTKYLKRLKESLDVQTYKNFEWIIVPNQSVTIPFEPNENIKIFPNNESQNIGFLKKYACNKSSGDVLVEVDHDDELFPTALETKIRSF